MNNGLKYDTIQEAIFQKDNFTCTTKAKKAEN